LLYPLVDRKQVRNFAALKAKTRDMTKGLVFVTNNNQNNNQNLNNNQVLMVTPFDQRES
jgi:hypothetical protein